MDLCLRNARLRGGTVADVGISDGKIVAVATGVPASAATEIDAKGTLVLPGFVNPHLHLDKALTGDMIGPRTMGSFQESVDLTLELRRAYSRDDLLRRGTEVLSLAVSLGTTAVRAFADVGTVGGLLPVQVVLESGSAFGV
jgi:cytosine deaminase